MLVNRSLLYQLTYCRIFIQIIISSEYMTHTDINVKLYRSNNFQSERIRKDM